MPTDAESVRADIMEIVYLAMNDHVAGLGMRTGKELSARMRRVIAKKDTRNGDKAYAMKIYSAARKLMQMHSDAPPSEQRSLI